VGPGGRGRGDADLAEIRKQIQSLKDDYEARIRALEDKLKDAEGEGGRTAPAPSAASANTGLAAFNPAVSLVLQGRYANLSQDPNTFAIAGFPLGWRSGAGTARLQPLRDRDDPLGERRRPLRGPGDDLHHAGQRRSRWKKRSRPTPRRRTGLAPKFGRFFSGIGYLNEQHQHAWDFVDAPLAYQAFLGGQYRNDGLQVKWIAPIEQYFEIGGEAGSGEAFPGSDRNKNGIGSGALYAHTGGDVGDSHSWRAGVSWLHTKSDERRAKDDTGIVDFVWKWAPNGNARQTSFKVQGEYFRRKEKGETAMIAPSSSIRPPIRSRRTVGTCRPSTSRSRCGAWACATTASIPVRPIRSTPQVERDGGLESRRVQPRAVAVRAKPDRWPTSRTTRSSCSTS
jgi:hypothetical protein